MQIIRSISITLLVFAVFLPVHAEAQTGFLQVTGEAGIRIYIDRDFAGITNDTDNGLFIEGLTPGEHQLKAVMKGRESVETQVEIFEGEAVEVQVELPELGPGAEEAEEPATEKAPMPKPHTNVGTFLLSSDPVGAKIYIDGEYKGDADIVVDNREAGRHTIVFKMGKQRLSGTYTLRKQEVLKLQANFLYEDIVNLSKKDRKRLSNRPLPASGR